MYTEGMTYVVQMCIMKLPWAQELLILSIYTFSIYLVYDYY